MVEIHASNYLRQIGQKLNVSLFVMIIDRMRHSADHHVKPGRSISLSLAKQRKRWRDRLFITGLAVRRRLRLCRPIKWRLQLLRDRALMHSRRISRRYHEGRQAPTTMAEVKSQWAMKCGREPAFSPEWAWRCKRRYKLPLNMTFFVTIRENTLRWRWYKSRAPPRARVVLYWWHHFR